MSNKQIPAGTAHAIPADLRIALSANAPALTVWKDLTPLARNEWICWITFVKQQTTRNEHIKRAISELKDGVRRPCCWIGCIHRTDKKLSPSIRGILEKRSKKA